MHYLVIINSIAERFLDLQPRAVPTVGPGGGSGRNCLANDQPQPFPSWLSMGLDGDGDTLSLNPQLRLS